MMICVRCFAFHDDYLLAFREIRKSRAWKKVVGKPNIGVTRRNAAGAWMCDVNCFAFEQRKMVKVLEF